MGYVFAGLCPVHDIVCCLLETPFEAWSENDQLDVLKMLRPQPVMCKGKTGDSSSKQSQFQMNWYYRFPWLCGSVYLQRLFCWPCLLFAKPEGIWFIRDEELLDGDMCIHLLDQHSNQTTHILNDHKLNLFKCRKGDIDKTPASDIGDATEIRLNRKCTTFAIDAILYMMRNKLLLCEVGGTGIGSHADLVELFISQTADLSVKLRFEEIRNSLLSNSIQYKIIHSVTECIGEHIKLLIGRSMFFVLRIDNGLDEKNEISLFLRFIDPSGNLKECFLGYYTLGGDKTSISMFKIVDFILSRYQYASKLIGVSYDTTCVKFNYLKDLRDGLKFIAKQVVNVNLLSHSLHFGLLESCLNSIPSVKIFFATLNSLLLVVQNLKMHSYSWNPHYWLQVFAMKSCCCSKHPLLTAIAEDWEHLVSNLICAAQDKSIPSQTITLARSVLTKIQEFRFVFFISFFREIFSVTSALNCCLRDRRLDVEICYQNVKSACVRIYAQRNEIFYSNFIRAAVLIMKQYPAATPLYQPEATYLNNKTFMPLYFVMIDMIIMEFHTRFENIEQYTFFNLRDTTALEFKKEAPKEADIDKLITMFPTFFKDKEKLTTQLQNYRENTLLSRMPVLTDHDEVVKLFQIIALLTPSRQLFPCLHQYAEYLNKYPPSIRPQVAKILMNGDVLNQPRHSFRDDILNKLWVQFEEIELSTMKNLNKGPIEQSVKPVETTPPGDKQPVIIRPTFAPGPATVVLNGGESSSHNPQPGPSSQINLNSYVLPANVQLAMTCETYLVAPDSGSEIKIREEPLEKKPRLGILSSSESGENSKELPGQQDVSQDAPIFIKEEIVCVENEDL